MKELPRPDVLIRNMEQSIQESEAFIRRFRDGGQWLSMSSQTVKKKASLSARPTK